jgi:hypothetical protein
MSGSAMDFVGSSHDDNHMLPALEAMTFLGRYNDGMLPALEAELDDLAPHILSFLDVSTLVRNKSVCRSWQRRMTETINQKTPIPPIQFQSGEELQDAINKYVKKYDPDDAEVFATT